MANIDEIFETDTGTVSLSKINSNFNNVNDDKIETDTIVTEIVSSGNDNDLATTKAIVNKIGALGGGNVTSAIIPADTDPVVYDGIGGNIVKNETRGSAFNKNFGNTTSDVVEIGTKLIASEIVETDANSKILTATKKTAYNADFGTGTGDVCEGDDDRLQQSTETNRGTVEKATTVEVVAGTADKFPDAKEMKDNFVSNSDNQVFTRAALNGTTSTNYSHNLGRVPTGIVFNSVQNVSSTGNPSRSSGSYSVEQDSNNCIWNINNGASVLSGTYSIYEGESTSYVRGRVTATTSTNFTIEWSGNDAGIDGMHVMVTLL